MPPTYLQRVLAIPLAIRLPFILLPFPFLALAGYWWWSYTGPYRWLAECQILLMDAYYPGCTGILTLGLMGALGLAPALLVFNVLIKNTAFPGDPVTAAPVGPHWADVWLRANRGRLTLLLVGQMFLISGGILLYTSLSVGPKQVVKLADLEAGRWPWWPSTRHIEVEGFPCWDGMLIQHSKKYVPLKSGQQPPDIVLRVAIFAEVSRVSNAPVGHKLTRWEGTLTLGGLPGSVRDRFYKAGVMPTPNYRVLAVGDTPEWTIEFGRPMLLLGLTVCGLTLLVWGIVIHRARAVP